MSPQPETPHTERRPRRRLLAPALTCLLTAGAVFALVVLPAGTGSTGADDDPTVQQGGGQAADWEPQPIAEELEAVAPMTETTIADALAAAEQAGLVDITQIVLAEDHTTVTGVDESGTRKRVDLGEHDAGTVSDEEGRADPFIDPTSLDVVPSEVVDRARDASGAEPDDEVQALSIYRGDGSESRGGETGTLLAVRFEGGHGVTLRASDLSVLW